MPSKPFLPKLPDLGLILPFVLVPGNARLLLVLELERFDELREEFPREAVRLVGSV
jgi:hypothetical protein